MAHTAVILVSWELRQEDSLAGTAQPGLVNYRTIRDLVSKT